MTHGDLAAGIEHLVREYITTIRLAAQGGGGARFLRWCRRQRGSERKETRGSAWLALASAGEAPRSGRDWSPQRAFLRGPVPIARRNDGGAGADGRGDRSRSESFDTSAQAHRSHPERRNATGDAVLPDDPALVDLTGDGGVADEARRGLIAIEPGSAAGREKAQDIRALLARRMRNGHDALGEEVPAGRSASRRNACATARRRGSPSRRGCSSARHRRG